MAWHGCVQWSSETHTSWKSCEPSQWPADGPSLQENLDVFRATLCSLAALLGPSQVWKVFRSKQSVFGVVWERKSLGFCLVAELPFLPPTALRFLLPIIEYERRGCGWRRLLPQSLGPDSWLPALSLEPAHAPPKKVFAGRPWWRRKMVSQRQVGCYYLSSSNFFFWTGTVEIITPQKGINNQSVGWFLLLACRHHRVGTALRVV